MQKFKSNKKGYLIWLMITVIVTAVAYILIFHVWEMDRTILIDDSEDSIGIASVAQNYISGIERMDLYSMPFTEEKVANIQSGVPYRFLLRIITLFCNSWGTAVNLLYFSSYPLIAACMFLVLAYMGSKPVVSACLSIIYAFLPYHYMRGEGHIYLGMYFLLPFICCLIFEIFTGEELTKAKIIFGASIIFFLGLADIYYTVFACILLVFAGLSGALLKCKIKYFFYSILLCILSLTGILAANIPFLWAILQGPQLGSGSADMGRSLVDLDIYGLRLVQLLLPIQNHRLDFLAAIRQNYDDSILYSETRMATLGLGISCGFIFSLFCCFFEQNRFKESSIIKQLGKLNVICVLLGTVGGFNVFVGMLSPTIRCYNRLSVFIATFSIFTLAYVLQYLYEKYLSKGRAWIFCAGMVGMTFLALLDQTPQFNPADYQERVSTKENIRLMVKEIEEICSDGDMIFMFPILTENENYVIGEMRPYEQRWPALYSDHLKWSSGTAGCNMQWKKWLLALPLEEELQNISVVGFAGVWVDQNGYSTGEFEYVKSVLDDYLGQPVIVSISGKQYFYSLAGYTADLKQDYTEEQWEDLRAQSLARGVNKGNYYGANSLYYLGAVEEDDQEAVIASGGLQYGPYIHLEAGAYSVTLSGKNLDIANLTITCDNGTVNVPYVIENESAEEMTISFCLKEDEERVEFVLSNATEKLIVLKYYYLIKE